MTFDNIMADLIEGEATFKDGGDRLIYWRAKDGEVSCSEVQRSKSSHTLSLHDPDSLDDLRKCYEYCMETTSCYIEERGKAYSPCALTRKIRVYDVNG